MVKIKTTKKQSPAEQKNDLPNLACESGTTDSYSHTGVE